MRQSGTIILSSIGKTTHELMTNDSRAYDKRLVSL